MQRRLVSSLGGVFASEGMAGNILDISGGVEAAAVIDKLSFADALFQAWAICTESFPVWPCTP